MNIKIISHSTCIPIEIIFHKGGGKISLANAMSRVFAYFSATMP